MSTVEPFPKFNANNIPLSLKLLAKHIELKEINAVRMTVVMEVLTPEGFYKLDVRSFGAEPFTVYHAVGLLTMGISELTSA